MEKIIGRQNLNEMTDSVHSSVTWFDLLTDNMLHNKLHNKSTTTDQKSTANPQ